MDFLLFVLLLLVLLGVSASLLFPVFKPAQQSIAGQPTARFPQLSEEQLQETLDFFKERERSFTQPSEAVPARDPFRAP